MTIRLINLFIAFIFSNALLSQGLEGIVVERYYQSDANDEFNASDNGAVTALPVGSITYRVYVDMADGYKFSQIFGTGDHNLTINTTTNFYNDPNYGVMINPATISANNIRKHTAMIDSWFTTGGVSNSKVGVMKSEDTDGSVGNQHGVLANNPGGCIGLPINGTGSADGMIPSSPSTYLVPNSLGLGSALSALDQTEGNSVLIDNGAIAALGGIVGPTTSNRVLIAQFTTSGTLTFQLNVQLVNIATGDAENYVASNPGVGELTHPSLTRTTNSNPTVSVTSPMNNATVPVGNWQITANAQDLNGPVQQVEFFVDGSSIGIDNLAPFTIDYNVASGTHQVYAVVTDMDCSTATSATINFNASSNLPPTISISGPNSAITGTTITFTATAADSDGSVSSVEFFVNGNSVGIDNTSPFSLDYTTTFGADQQVYAIAIDNAGATTTSNTLSFNVANNAAPTIIITSPNSGDVFIAPATVTIIADAADSDGNVTMVEFFVDDQSIGMDMSAPYSIDWTSTIGEHTIHAVATDNLGATGTSIDVNITVADPNALPYSLINTSINCSDETVCVPLEISVTAPLSGAIGLDVSIAYDETKLTPTGDLTLTSNIISSSAVDYLINTSTPGELVVSLFLNGSSSNASFNGFGELFCVEFNRNNEFGFEDTTQLNIINIVESYTTETIETTGSGCDISSSINNNYTSKVEFWFDQSPLMYDESSPTTIQGFENGMITNVNNPSFINMSGEFSHDLQFGDSLYIHRDYDNNQSILHYINGADAYLLKTMLNDNSFVPSYYQIAAMDVNLDGVVSAGDISQIMLRATHEIDEFQQAWNYDEQGNSNGQPSKDWIFFSSNQVSTDPFYQVSANFPNTDGSGYSINELPTVSFAIPASVEFFGTEDLLCPQFGIDTCVAILLGDIDGSFVEFSNTISSNDSMWFDLSAATYTSQFGEHYIEIPVQLSLGNTSAKSADFRLNFDLNKLIFDTISYLLPELTGMAYFNSTTELLSFSSSVNTSSNQIAEDVNIAIVKFKLNDPCDRIVASDFSNIDAMLNGLLIHHQIIDSDPLPSIEIISSTPYCAGEEIGLNYADNIFSDNITTYTWTSPSAATATGDSPMMVFNSDGNQIVTLNLATEAGCNYTQQLNITINPSPVVAFTGTIDATDQSIDFTNQSTISSGNIATYTWDFGDDNTSTSTNPSHTYVEFGMYDVMLTATSSEGCTSSFTSSFDVPDFIFENNSNHHISIYPNPAQNMVFLKHQNPCVIHIIDGTGKTVMIKEYKNVNSIETIDISEFAAGTYMLEFLGNERSESYRLIVSR